VPALTGTGRIADDLYLLAHHDVTGRPFLQPRALGAGLAGALLAELVLAGTIRVLDDQIHVAGPLPADGLADHIAQQLLGEHQWHPARDWLAFLTSTAEQDVAVRLARAGYLTQVSSRRPWRPARWVPADSDAAFAPLIRIRIVLDPARTATVPDVALAGLAAACGLGSRIVQYGRSGARHRLDEAVRYLQPPDLRELIACTQSAVDSAVLSHRM
jgi:hypothetical protein